MLINIFPGQGSQHIGMGKDLFERFPDKVQLADRILGYATRDICLRDAEGKLNRTEYTQPLLFLVNALHYWDERSRTGKSPEMVAGHSLGEYNALLAAEVFDFETGLRLVAKRGELMSKAEPGSGMAAVIGLDGERVASVLQRSGLDRLDIANMNSPTQVVISGLLTDIGAAQAAFEAEGARYVKLNVSAAFHSRYMRPAQEQFARFLGEFHFAPPRLPVIANISARSYAGAEIAKLLTDQIVGSVRWVESVRYMMARGAADFRELGPKRILSELVKQITPLGPLPEAPIQQPIVIRKVSDTSPAPVASVETPLISKPPAPDIQAPRAAKDSLAEMLGSDGFKADHRVRYAYLAGGMHKGVSSVDMVANMARRGFLASLGTFGLPATEVVERLAALRSALPNGEPFAVNIFSNIAEPDSERQLLDVCMKHGITTVEASGYTHVTPALVRFRLSGLRLVDGKIETAHRIIVKLSQLETAASFLQPASDRLITDLVARGEISREQADLARGIPLADDICLESEGGWYSERGGGWLLFPALRTLRDEMQRDFGYARRPRIGLSGGIGDPDTAAAAFFLGADFIVTGTINQCTVEAGTSDLVKDMLQDCGLQDTIFAPGGELFEFGAQIQFLRKGVFFPARANKLYLLYQSLGSVEELDAKTRTQLEEKYFGKALEEVWKDVAAYWQARMPDELTRAAQNPRYKLLLLLRWYFKRAAEAAHFGRADEKVQFSIPCSTAMGTFNHWVRGTELQSWRNRRVADIALHLLHETGQSLQARLRALDSVLA